MRNTTDRARETHYDILRREGHCPFSLSELYQLHRYASVAHRWAERECNGEIERDEKTGKYFRSYDPGYGPRKLYPMADRLTPLENRAIEIITKAGWSYQLQGDPRGCPLYLSPKPELKDSERGEYALG